MLNKKIQKMISEIELLFKNANIKILDSSRHIIYDNRKILMEETPSFSKFKEINTVEIDNYIYYRMSFPIQQDLLFIIHLPVKDIDDIFVAAKMIDSIISLIQSISSYKKKDYSQSESTFLLRQLLHHHQEKVDNLYAALLISQLGFDMSILRAACIFKLDYNESAIANQRLLIYSIYQSILSFSMKQDIVGIFNPDEIIMFRVVEDNVSSLLPSLTKIYQFINNNYPVTCKIGVGFPTAEMWQYDFSYDSAHLSFDYSKYYNNKINIYFITDYFIQYLMNSMKDSLLTHFFSDSFHYLENNPVIAETLHILVQNNMDIDSSASTLFIHRNTLIFRINQLKNNLNIKSMHYSKDNFRLMMLDYYYQTHHK